MSMIKIIKPNANSYALNASRVTDGIISCTTAAGTAAKTATASNFTLETGARILIQFTNTNTASNPTLNINSTGAKAIYYHNSAITASYLKANYIYEFVYDGTQYEYVGEIMDNSSKANIASPTFTGTPTAPTAASGTNTQQIATTAFVQNAIKNALANFGVAETTYFPTTD